jgi:hypothetical protein
MYTKTTNLITVYIESKVKNGRNIVNIWSEKEGEGFTEPFCPFEFYIMASELCNHREENIDRALS